MVWSQLDWLSITAFAGAVATPATWECGALVGQPTVGLGALFSTFLEADVLVSSRRRQLYTSAPLAVAAQSCATAFFFDELAPLSRLPAPALAVAARTTLAPLSLFEATRLYCDVATSAWAPFWASEVFALLATASVAAAPTWFAFILSVDPALLFAELLALALILFVAPRPTSFRLRRRGGYDDVVTFCQTNNVSLTELGALTTLTLAFVGFDFFLAFVEDDPTEVFSCLVLALAVAGGLGLVLAFDVQYFYMVSALGGGNAALVAFNDLVANALCVLRIFLCWTRYIFYDFQVEALDWTFHYVEGAGEAGLGSLLGVYRVAASPTAASAPSLWEVFWAPLFWFLWVLVDLWFFAFQVLVAIFKYAIALFLMWLLFDLFWFRPLADSESRSLASARR